MNTLNTLDRTAKSLAIYSVIRFYWRMKYISLPLLLLLPFALFAADDHGNVSVEILAQSDRSWDGVKLPAYPTEDPQMSVVKVTIPPHSKLKWHKHPSMNAGYMISGEILVTAEDGQTRVVKAGEGLIEMVNTWHYGRNDGDVPAEIVVVYSGVKDRPLAIIKEDAE
ncbi:MAG: cupin domain-containing protein [Opitutales bacterium]|jgi:quercetin dioxygenase-like cupin family protein|nr:cupin domain-containing protein [Opitutales bacterium]MDP4644108.1 cupin domain-containing protein [Opitutales bacterium]MDP4693169.1 cupin domain-containing protein [Opitutales bacterium]MDP4778391.1 cupin domain-containing protein [Opitutales bacterium]MDP4883316.1 cupin domain-containing protein [Opitutales bacterium]